MIYKEFSQMQKIKGETTNTKIDSGHYTKMPTHNHLSRSMRFSELQWLEEPVSAGIW